MRVSKFHVIRLQSPLAFFSTTFQNKALIFAQFKLTPWKPWQLYLDGRTGKTPLQVAKQEETRAHCSTTSSPAL